MKRKRLILSVSAALLFSSAASLYFHFQIFFSVLIFGGLVYMFYFLDPKGPAIFTNPGVFTDMTLLFLIFLFIPVFFFILGGGKASSRFDTSLPEKDAFKNNFVFREALIRANSFLKVKLFGVSAVPKVIIGKDGWLYQARESESFQPRQGGYFSSVQPFTNRELREWKQALEKRYRWCESRGMFYLFILAPDKSSIYPEYLPDGLRPFYNRSRLDQLAAFLKTHSPVPVLNLKEVLIEAKKEREVYYKTDSHWNEYGACIASAAIFDYLKQALDLPGETGAFSAARYRVRKRKPRGGNLAVMLTLENSVFREDKFKLLPRFKSSVKKGRMKTVKVKLSSSIQAHLTETRNAAFRNAVMLHDSFGRKLKFFLSEYFNRILYLRDWGFGFHSDVLEAENPRIVLDEMAEHFLYNKRLL